MSADDSNGFDAGVANFLDSVGSHADLFSNGISEHAKPSNASMEQQFSDLLAEFTLPSTMAGTPEASGTDSRLEGLGSPEYDSRMSKASLRKNSMSPKQSQNTQASASQHLADAIAGMNPETQSQLLMALLAAQNGTGPSGPASNTTNGVQSHHQTAHTSQQHHNTSAGPSRPPSITAQTPYPTTSQPASQHSSPMPYPISTNVPRSQPTHYSASAASSMPGSAAQSPLASPYITSNPVQSPFFPASYPTNVTGPGQMNFVLSHLAQQNPQLFQQLSGGVPITAQVNPQQLQMMMENLVRANPSMAANFAGLNSQPQASSVRSSADSWTDREGTHYGFSPATSIQSPATSYQPSGSVPPLGTQGLNPNEVFYPLGSPAIVPAGYNPTDGMPWSPAHSLQGLVDQTRAMGFDAASMHGSPQAFTPHDMSPRILPTTSGSTKRGASANSRKARPSPLLKPTPDSQMSGLASGPKRKSTTTKRGKRDSVAGSVGSTSAQSSPFIGPSQPYQKQGESRSTTTTTPKTSTDENGSQGSINTPSPVDLAMTDPLGRQVTNGVDSGSMGPPAAPNNKHMNHIREEPVNPATPGTFMNLSSDLTAAGLSASPFQQHTTTLPTFSALPIHFGLSPEEASPPASHALNDANLQAAAQPERPNASGSRQDSFSTVHASGSDGAASTSTTVPASKAATSKPSKAPAPKKGPSNRAGPSPRIRASDSSSRAMSNGKGDGPDHRKSSHKVAEQRRRDSLKMCFEQLRRLLPPMLGTIDESDRRPGEGNVGGQRNQVFDPDNPNKGVSKAALLRRSNEYLEILHGRIERRDNAIEVLRKKLEELRTQAGLKEADADVEALDLDALDKDEKGPMSMAYYEGLNDSEDEDEAQRARAAASSSTRRKSLPTSVPPAIERPKRRTARYNGFDEDGDDMDLED